MTKLTDNVDVATLSPEDALAWYQTLAEGFAREEGLDPVRAWAKPKFLYPALAERANIGHPVRVEPAGRYESSAGIIGGAVQPLTYAADCAGRAPNLAAKLLPRAPLSLPNAGNIELLGLPTDASFEEFRAADHANGGATPRNSGAIFEALVGLQVQSGLSIDAARDAARDRYPKLFSESDNARAASANILGERDDTSRNAHTASANANSRGSHVAAALAHQTAAELDGKAGDTERMEMHQAMSKYHQRQAKRLEPA
jgi:hypothetical protein